jgi:hypothetical protein
MFIRLVMRLSHRSFITPSLGQDHTRDHASRIKREVSPCPISSIGTVKGFRILKSHSLLL